MENKLKEKFSKAGKKSGKISTKMKELKTNREKADFLASQLGKCTDDFHSGFIQGVMIALNISEREKYEIIEQIYNDWFSVPDYDFGNYLFTKRLTYQLRTDSYHNTL